MDAFVVLADVVPPTSWVVENLVLPIIGFLALVGIAVILIRRRRRMRRSSGGPDA